MIDSASRGFLWDGLDLGFELSQATFIRIEASGNQYIHGPCQHPRRTFDTSRLSSKDDEIQEGAVERILFLPAAYCMLATIAAQKYLVTILLAATVGLRQVASTLLSCADGYLAFVRTSLGRSNVSIRRAHWVLGTGY
jgi:hypothetical protein